jgi:hypothetical protein
MSPGRLASAIAHSEGVARLTMRRSGAEAIRDAVERMARGEETT